MDRCPYCLSDDTSFFPEWWEDWLPAEFSTEPKRVHHPEHWVCDCCGEYFTAADFELPEPDYGGES